MADTPDEALRVAAAHRGLRLKKSQRRKPGGDFGRFGLVDANTGAERLGFGSDGLTATAEDIADFLRTDERSSWTQSVSTTPDAPRKSRPKAEPKPKAPPATLPARRPTRPKPTPEPEPAPKPPLGLRAATAEDAPAIAALIRATGGPTDTAMVTKRLAEVAPIVAERGKVIGCVAWALLPSLQHGTVGRITLIVVAEGERRRGIGRMLLDAAETALRAGGCTMIEAMSDIEIVNTHGFFRRTGYAQTSYRFARTLEA